MSQNTVSSSSASRTNLKHSLWSWTAKSAVALATLFALVVPTQAASPHRTRSRFSPSAFAAIHIMPGSLSPGVMAATDVTHLDGEAYHLKLHHLHTNENIDIVYRIGNMYIPGAIERLNYFLRDHRTEDTSHYDPKEFDLLHNLLERLHKTNGEIDIVCGYRTPWSNNFLRTRGRHTGVAKESQHVQAKAIDIRIPGITTRKLRDVAQSLGAGGVGYYPVSQFVHVDVGPVRTWSFSGRGDN